MSPRPFAVTNRSVVAIAVPMTLAFLSTPLAGIVDTAVIGQLGEAALIGGIAVGSVVFSTLFMTFNFLRSGTTGLTAQALGAGDGVEERAVFLRALVVALAAGLALIVLQAPLMRLALALMAPGPEVAAATKAYFAVRIMAAPFTLANYALLGVLLGLGRSGLGLLLQTVLNGLNIVLSIAFVLHFRWGVEGVAAATVLAEALTSLVGLGLAVLVFRGGPMPGRAVVFDRQKFVRMAAVNRDIMVRSFALLFSFAFFTAQGARFGDVTLAANAVLMNFFLFSGYFLDGFATAAEQLAGRAIGARWRPAFDRAVRLTVIWGFVLAGLLAVLLALEGGLFIDLMTTAEDVRAAAREFLPWAALTPVAGTLAFQMDGVFIGATWSRDMRNMMLASLALYLGVWAIAVPLIGNHGLWLALVVFLSVRGLSLSAILPVRARASFAVGGE